MDVITKYLMRPSSEIKAVQSYAKNRDSDSPPPHKHLHHIGGVVVEEEALARVEGCDGLHIVMADMARHPSRPSMPGARRRLSSSIRPAARNPPLMSPPPRPAVVHDAALPQQGAVRVGTDVEVVAAGCLEEFRFSGRCGVGGDEAPGERVVVLHGDAAFD